MAIAFSRSAEKELSSFSREEKEYIAHAVSLMENENFRELNKIDLCIEENGCGIWAMTFGPAWVAFHDVEGGDICVDWISIRSRFRQ
jgi:mRNA-degrading endonuclease RelE of RelBE toxin-antitoxin system